MHGYVSEQEFIDQIAGFLGWYYLAASLMNAIAVGWSLCALRQDDRQPAARALLIVSAVGTVGFLVLGSTGLRRIRITCFRCRTDCATPPIGPWVRW